MPEFITEDQYIAVEELIETPPPNTTDFHITAWKNHQNSYKDQQFRAGIPDLTPKRTSANNQISVENIYNSEKLFKNGIPGIDISNEPDKDVLTGPKSIAARANKKALAEFYGVDINKDNYGRYKGRFSVDYLGRSVTDEIDFYEAISPVFLNRAETQRKADAVGQQAVVNYYKGLPVSESLKQLRTLGTPNEAKIIELHRNLDAVINPVRPYIDRALNALERKTKDEVALYDLSVAARPLGAPEETIGEKAVRRREEIAADQAQDEKALNDLRDILLKTHPSNRAKIMQKMMGEAESRGKATVNDVRTLFNEAVDSAKNVFEGFAAFDDMNQEIALRKMQFNVGDGVELITTGLKEIKTPEQAREYIMTKLRQEEYIVPDETPFVEKGLPTVPLDEQSSKLLRDVKADLLSTVEFDRDVRSLEKSVDPFREGWQTTMATTVGSSVGIIGMYSLASAAGPMGIGAALAATGSIYTGLNYEQIRAKYPDLAPEKARNVAIVSGGIEALLDLGQYKIISKAFQSLGFKKAIDLSGRSAVGNFTREAGKTAISTYVFEGLIELGQEGVRPVVQAIFAEFDKEYSINSSQEWAAWQEAVPHILIGMAPLAMVGGLGAGSRAVLADSYLKKEVMEEGKLAAFGLEDEQIVEVQQLIHNNMYNAAREKLKEYNKDQNVINNRQAALEKVVAANGIDQIRAYEEARKEGIIPRYTVDEATGEYTLEDGTVLPDQRAYIETTRARVAEAEQQYTQSITDLISGKVEAEADLDINELQAKTNLLGRLKGFSQQELTTFDNIFGSNEVEQNDTYEQLIVNIAEKGNLEGIKSYIDGVYNNIPQNVRNALGKDKAEGVDTLFKLVTGQSAAVRAESDLTDSNIVIQDAIHDVSFVDTPLELNNQNIELRYSDERKKQAKKKGVKANPIEAVAISDIQQTPGGNYVKSIVDFIQSNYDVRISFVRGQEVNGDYLGPIGYSEGKDIIIDIDRAKGSLLNHVIGHEFAHFLNNFEDVYNEVSNAIISTVDKTTLDRYMGMFDTEIEAQKELVSDTFGQRFRDIKFWESVTTAMYQQNTSKADNFIGIVKEYLGKIKSALSRDLANRDISNAEFSDFSKMNSAIVGAMLKARGRPADGTTQGQRMEAIPNPENRSVDYVTRKLRDQINAAMSQIKQVGGTEVGKKRLIQSLIEPQTEQQYNEIVAYRQESINRRINKERKEGKNIGRTLRGISNRLYKALKDGNVTAKLLAEAEAAINVVSAYTRGTMPAPLSFEDVSKIKNNPTETVMDYIRVFNEGRVIYLNEFVNDGIKKVLNGVLSHDVVKKNPIIKEFFEDVEAALFGDIASIKAELSDAYQQLYTTEDIPIEMDADTFERLTTKYSIFKAFGGWELRSIDEREQVINQAISWGRAVFEPNVKVKDFFVNARSEELITSSIQEIATNPNTVERTRSKIPLIGGIFSYLDNHITFSSELELLSPSIGTPGSPITTNLQRVNDMLINAYLNIQDEQIDIQNSVLSKAESIFKVKTKEAVRKIYELLTEKTITVNIKGKEVKLKEGYAGYILNIDDQIIYETQLNKAGFTDQVIQDIRSQISSEANDLRIKLRDDLIKIIKRNNAKTRESGKPAIDPSDLFFPVQKSSLLRSVVDNFDIAFGNGLQPENVQNALQNEKDELEFDLKEQNINFISMFNSHAYQTTHKANLFEPISILKRIFNSQAVREKLDEKIGIDGIRTIFKFINALEYGGIITTEFARSQKEMINQILSGTARASLGFNLKTYAVNAMSAGNILLDTSIPTFIKIKAFMGALGGTFTVDGRSSVDKIIKRRSQVGANALLQAVRGSSENIAPGVLKDISDRSLQAIGEIDAYFLTYSAIAAYNAHYAIGKKQNLQGDALHIFAEKGMIRTITKVAQPNMAATKSYLEQSSNPYMRTVAMFMSETRKNFGLEYTALRKGGLEPGQYIDIFVMNHLILGSGSYALRAIAGTVLGEEDPWDLKDWMLYVLSGPLSGIVLFGAVGDGLIKQIYNLFAESAGLEKARIFQPSIAPVRTVNDIMDIKDVFNADKTINERVDAAATAIESGGAILNKPWISGLGSLADAVTDVYKGIMEREEE